MNTYLSDKIRLLSFILIILVVTLHTNNGFVFFYETGRTDYLVFLKNFISNGVALVAVPLFFSFSGYLFFVDEPVGKGEILTKIKKRVKSLVVPYLFWSVVGLLTFLLLSKLGLVKSDFVDNMSLSKIIMIICFKPIPFQFWFIRNLVLLVLISPLIYSMIKRFGYFLAIFSGLIWMLNIDFIPVQGIVNGNQGLSFFFFVVGSTIALKKEKYLQENYARYSIALILTWVVMLSVDAYYDSISVVNIKVLNVFDEDTAIYLLLFKLSILVGIGVFWCTYDLLFFDCRDITKTSLYSISRYTFFIYAFHEPLQSVIRSKLLNESVIKDSFLFSYLLALFTTCFIAISVAFLTKRYLPTMYGIATGWR